MNSSPLDQLRDIHTPADISWWPLAPGWWLMIAAIIMLIFVLWRKLNKHRAHKLQQQLALKALADIDANSADAAEQINSVLKRGALAYFPRQQVAQLHGDEWAKFLLDKLHTKTPCPELDELTSWFSTGYRPHSNTELHQAFLDFAKAWLNTALPGEAVEVHK